jgi:hypothetical protein
MDMMHTLTVDGLPPIKTIVYTKRAYMHCKGIAYCRSFYMGSTSAEDQKLVMDSKGYFDQHCEILVNL